MKNVIGMAAIMSVLAYSSAAFAGNAGDGSGYGTQPGYDNAIANSNGCAGAGAFGAFGKGYNLGNDVSGHFPSAYSAGPGANGQATGYFNSNNCGNPQNGKPAPTPLP
jgi:hypothetical protein